MANPALGLMVKPVDVGRAMRTGAGIARNKLAIDLAREEAQAREARRNALSRYGASAMQGDRNALAEIARVNPSAARNFLTMSSEQAKDDRAAKTFEEGQKKAQRERFKTALQQSSRLLKSVLSTPEGKRADAYRRAREQAISAGLFSADDPNVPAEWTPETEGWARSRLDFANAMAGKDPATLVTGEAAKRLGFPENVIVQQDEKGKYSVVYNPDKYKYRTGSASARKAEASNYEIDAARQAIKSIEVPPGSTLRAEIAKRLTKDTVTGPNPDYDPLLASQLKAAVKAKVGGDGSALREFVASLGAEMPQETPPSTEPGATPDAANAVAPNTASDSSGLFDWLFGPEGNKPTGGAVVSNPGSQLRAAVESGALDAPTVDAGAPQQADAGGAIPPELAQKIQAAINMPPQAKEAPPTQFDPTALSTVPPGQPGSLAVPLPRPNTIDEMREGAAYKVRSPTGAVVVAIWSGNKFIPIGDSLDTPGAPAASLPNENDQKPAIGPDGGSGHNKYRTTGSK